MDRWVTYPWQLSPDVSFVIQVSVTNFKSAVHFLCRVTIHGLVGDHHMDYRSPSMAVVPLCLFCGLNLSTKFHVYSTLPSGV